jgi:hypothetical protein
MGRRTLIHISLSPEAITALKELCERDIAPIPQSALIEHLLLQKWSETLTNNQPG